MEEVKSEVGITPEISGCSSQTRKRRKSSSVSSLHCKARRKDSASHLPHSLASDNSTILKSDDDFGQYIAGELKRIDSVRTKQFAKLQIHSVLFNAQFNITSIPVHHHQSFCCDVSSVI